MHATGEQVDLLTFSPVCLPSEGDNFDGSDGVVAGSQFLFAGFFVSFLFSKDGVWQSHMVTFLLKFFMMSRWGFHLMLFSFLNSYCKQIPIIGKADCEKNMEENGNTFTEGLLCAGGNRKGSCKVQTHSLSKTLSNSIDLKTLSNISSGWQRRSLDYRRWGFGWSCQCRRSRSVCEGEVLFLWTSKCKMILQKKYSIHYLNITKLIWNQSEPELTLFSQENVYDLYTEVASYMTWINSTIMKMGGMQACGLVFEETSPEGDILSLG